VSINQVAAAPTFAFTSNFLAPRDPRKASCMGAMTGVDGNLGFHAARVVNLRLAPGARKPGSLVNR
jgi:hypothetical protein